MRYALTVLAILSMTACDDTTPAGNETTQYTVSASGTLGFGTSYETLLAQFKDMSFDTLAVTVPNLETGDSPFMGVPLDSAMTALLPEEISRHDSSFAIGRFVLDANNTALLARVPGEYVSNHVALLVYNHTRRKIYYKGNVAYTWGDAGDWEYQDSWLIRTKDNLLQQLTELTTGSTPDEEDPETAKDMETTAYYLLDIRSEKTDTLSKDSTGLLQTYGHLLRKPAVPATENQ